MQSDPRQGDPRLQKTNPGPVVGVRDFDPCLLFLESTLPGEIPLLAACWASRCHEYRTVGGNSSLALAKVLVVQNQALGHIQRRRLWEFGMRYERTIFLICGGKAGGSEKCDFKSTPFNKAPAPVFKWHVRYLSREENLGIEQSVDRLGKEPNGFATVFFRHANIDWPSIADAMSSLQHDEKCLRHRSSRSRRPTIVDRLISAFTGEPLPA